MFEKNIQTELWMEQKEKELQVWSSTFFIADHLSLSCATRPGICSGESQSGEKLTSSKKWGWNTGK
jgi:hypothetical protein